MINLFKKNIYSFLSFTITTITITTTTTVVVAAGDYNLRLQRALQPILGLGLINATRVANRSRNVIESTMLKPNNNPSLSKRIGFIDDIGDEVDGLMSCTESLGSESSDERHQQQQPSLFPLGVDDRIGQIHGKNDNDSDNDDNKKDVDDEEDADCDLWRRRMMTRAEGRGNLKKMKSFPPPLSWLNRNGKPSFILRPVRKDGRLELTEVRIQRPEILHASRHDGRLTLHLIPDRSIEEEEEELDTLLDEENMLEEEVDAILDEEIMVHEEEVDEEIRVDDEEEILDDAMVDGEITVEEERVGMGVNEGLRRCYEMVNQHNHHHVHGSHHHHHMRQSTYACHVDVSVVS